MIAERYSATGKGGSGTEKKNSGKVYFLLPLGITFNCGGLNGLLDCP